jgi:F0F1-type ATP synthase assembly protein I
MQGLFGDDDKNTVETVSTDDSGAPDESFILSSYTPPTQGEVVRQSGLAWSAGIAFFGAIVFMLFLGWIADLLLGISPWGIVGGIVLGSIIGFLQFFRITSQIFKNNDSLPSEHPILSQPEKPAARKDPFDDRNGF